MRPFFRNTVIYLCLFTVAGLLAQPIVTSRIQSVKSIQPGIIEIQVIGEKVGIFDPDLSAPAFKVTENGIRQDLLQVDALPPQGSASRTVILADLSLSVTSRQFANFKLAALRFVDSLKPGDLVGLITFDRRVFRELNFTADRALIRTRIENLRRRGRRTMLYDALVEAHKMLSGATERKAIVVYTDGRENASRVHFDDVVELYTSSPVPVFIAGKSRTPALRRLVRLARISGGDAFRADDMHDLSKVFSYLTRLKAESHRITYKTTARGGAVIDLEVETGTGQTLVRSYTIPTQMASESLPGGEKLFSAPLFVSLRTHMPEILLSLIVLLLIAVIIMLFFRRQEITVKVENFQPQALVSDRELSGIQEKRSDLNKAKLPLDYHHGWLVEKEGPHTGRKYKINWHVVTLGFSDDNSIVIEDNTVSARHAKIEREGRNFVLYDMLSENGTYLNGKKLLRPKELSDFDEIGLGRTRLVFRKGATSPAPVV